MGIFTKDKKGDKPQKEPVEPMVKKDPISDVQTGFILLDKCALDWQQFKVNLQQEWGIVPTSDEKDDSVVFDFDDMMVAVSLMPARVPGDEAEANARNNLLWREGEDVVKSHKAHILLAVMGGKDALLQAQLFVKVASVLLSLPNALAIYYAPTAFPPKYYIENAAVMHKNQIPLPLLVYVGLYEGESGVGGYTLGMSAFGKLEIEVLESRASAWEIYSFLLSIAEYVLSQDVVLMDGETIGFSEDQKLPISRGEGVAVPGNSIKIEYHGEEAENPEEKPDDK